MFEAFSHGAVELPSPQGSDDTIHANVLHQSCVTTTGYWIWTSSTSLGSSAASFIPRPTCKHMDVLAEWISFVVLTFTANTLNVGMSHGRLMYFTVFPTLPGAVPRTIPGILS